MSSELELEDLELLLGSVGPPLDATKNEAPNTNETTSSPALSSSSTLLSSMDKKKEDTGSQKMKKNRKEKKHRKRLRHEKKKREEEGESEDKDRERRRHSKYVLDEAESSSGEDSFIADDEEEDGIRQPLYQGLPSARTREEVTQASAARRNLLFEQEGANQLTDEELGKQYEERARWLKEQRKAAITQRKGMNAVGGDRDFEGTTIDRQQLTSLRYTSQMLPQPSDPKVFAVKCKPRMARILVARIVNKCYAYRMGINLERKMDLGVLSVFSLDHVKEYIYVEAYRQSFVTNALEGFVGIFRFTITQVSPTELLQMLEKKPKNDKVAVGELVRLRQRPYRGDLAQVVKVMLDSSRRAVVKVIPREDFAGKAYHKTTTVLPQRFFSPQQAVGAEERGDHIRWGDLRFDRDGYLLKTISVRSLMHGAQLQPIPEGEELTIFLRHNRELVKEAVVRYATEGCGPLVSSIRIGDTVRVVSGELKNTVGTVTNLLTNSRMAILSCPIPQQKTPISLRVELCDCTKHFPEGTHVVVEEGEYRGRSGTVVKSYGEVVVLFCDRDDKTPEITVKANDCYQSKLVTSRSRPLPLEISRGVEAVGNSSSFGNWNIYDLVRLVDSRAVGCIVMFHLDRVEVLTEDNESRILTYAQVTPIGRGNRKGVDVYQNVLERGGEVTVQEKDWSPFHLGGSSGRIEQVFHETVFVRFVQRKVNAGLVAMPTSCVLLTGGRKTIITDNTAKRLKSLLPPPTRKVENAVMADYSSDAKGDTWDHHSEYVGDSESFY